MTTTPPPADRVRTTGSFVAVRPLVPTGLGRVEMAGRITGGRGLRSAVPRRYPHHAVVLVTQGSGCYRGPRGVEQVPTGSLVLVRPGEPHWYGPGVDEVWDETFCAFSGPVFDLAVARGALGGALGEALGGAARVVPVTDVTRVHSLLDGIRVAAPPLTTAAQDAEALTLLAGLNSAFAPAAPSQGAAGWLARSMQLLADEGGGDLAEVAAVVGLPYETWRRRFRAEVGVAPGRYRVEARLRTAAGLLTMTQESVLQIAHRTGFVDDRHLARQFTRRYGTTPGRYRRHGSG